MGELLNHSTEGPLDQSLCMKCVNICCWKVKRSEKDAKRSKTYDASTNTSTFEGIPIQYFISYLLFLPYSIPIVWMEAFSSIICHLGLHDISFQHFDIMMCSRRSSHIAGKQSQKWSLMNFFKTDVLVLHIHSFRATWWFNSATA